MQLMTYHQEVKMHLGIWELAYSWVLYLISVIREEPPPYLERSVALELLMCSINCNFQVTELG